MKLLISILRIFARFYWVKKKIISFSKSYLIKAHIIPLVNKISDIKIYENNSLTIKDAILSDAFRNGLIEHFLKPNDYILNAKDIAIAINMGVFGHSNSSFINENTIDIAFYLDKKIKERLILDDNLKYIFKELGKMVKASNNEILRKDIEIILNDKKQIFRNYFELYNSNNYTEKVIVYYPGYGKSWLEWKKDESLEISIFEYDIPIGFFLVGFDYESSRKGWLRLATRFKENEFFNPNIEEKGKMVWLK